MSRKMVLPGWYRVSATFDTSTPRKTNTFTSHSFFPTYEEAEARVADLESTYTGRMLLLVRIDELGKEV